MRTESLVNACAFSYFGANKLKQSFILSNGPIHKKIAPRSFGGSNQLSFITTNNSSLTNEVILLLTQ